MFIMVIILGVLMFVVWEVVIFMVLVNVYFGVGVLVLYVKFSSFVVLRIFWIWEVGVWDVLRRCVKFYNCIEVKGLVSISNL